MAEHKTKCDCIERINGHLAADAANTKLKLSFVLDGPRVGMYPVIATDLIEKKRGARPMAIIPSFCPFCGIPYPRQEEQP